jgi:hypothetical protein
MTRPAGVNQIALTRAFALSGLAAVAVLVVFGALRSPEAAATCGTPSIGGAELVGGTLTATAGGCSDPLPPDVSLEWYRCSGDTPATCTTSVKARQPSPSSYTPTAADAGHRLGVKQVAVGVLPVPEEDWAFTGVIQQPATPPPGGGDPGGGGGGGGPGEQAKPLLSPFPLVMIAGRLTRRGARVTRLSVRAPRGSTVLVRCRGGGCPRRAGRAKVGRKRTVRLRRFQGHLRTGAVLELVITKPGFIGKYTRFQIRRRRAPQRTDLCVQPGSKEGSACPA